MKIINGLLLGAAVTLLTACGGSSNNNDSQTSSSFKALFSPLTAVLPYPSNLLFSGTTDGTLNIPADSDPANDTLIAALNSLDGFSTIAPIYTQMATAINASSISGSSVHVFEVTLSGFAGAPIAVTDTLVFGDDFTASVAGDNSDQLVITPLKPLSPESSYLLAITSQLTNQSGEAAAASEDYALLQGDDVITGDKAALEAMRPLVNQQEQVLAAQGIASNSVALSWSFTTQSVGKTLAALHVRVTEQTAAAITLVDTGASSPLGAADMFSGTLSVPYYLTAAANTTDASVLVTPWSQQSLNAAPTATDAALTIPVLATIPKSTPPESGWPVVIFQHGITGNRTHMLAVADTLAANGMATIAIDLPLHGLAPSEALYQAGNERTFDLDLANNATLTPGPDGTADSSGTHFISFTNPRISRDHMRQGVADLMTLTKALSGVSQFDSSSVSFIGHSLGGMVGTPFLAQDASPQHVQASVLLMTGGGIAKLLDGSLAFGPVIAAGMAAQGINKGSFDYELLLGVLQTVLDTTDPVNHGAAAAADRAIYFSKVAGDKVVPNNVTTSAPSGTTQSATAGTEPLIAAMGLTQASTSDSGTPLKVNVNFSAGHHSSVLRANESDGVVATADEQAVLIELQAQIGSFLSSKGTSLTITDTSVVE